MVVSLGIDVAAVDDEVSTHSFLVATDGCVVAVGTRTFKLARASGGAVDGKRCTILDVEAAFVFQAAAVSEDEVCVTADGYTRTIGFQVAAEHPPATVEIALAIVGLVVGAEFLFRHHVAVDVAALPFVVPIEYAAVSDGAARCALRRDAGLRPCPLCDRAQQGKKE